MKFRITVVERVAYTFELTAPDHARAGDAAKALLVEYGSTTRADPLQGCTGYDVADRCVTETEEI